MSEQVEQLLVRFAQAMGLTYKQMGAHAGASARTVQRWFARESHPIYLHLHRLARAAHPIDPALAADLARAGGTTLEALGLGPAAPPAGPGPRAADAETVLCAAAEAMDVSPRAIRPALVAAFARAAELGLGVADVARVLAAKLPKAPKG